MEGLRLDYDLIESFPGVRFIEPTQIIPIPGQKMRYLVLERWPVLTEHVIIESWKCFFYKQVAPNGASSLSWYRM